MSTFVVSLAHCLRRTMNGRLHELSAGRSTFDSVRTSGILRHFGSNTLLRANVRQGCFAICWTPIPQNLNLSKGSLSRDKQSLRCSVSSRSCPENPKAPTFSAPPRAWKRTAMAFACRWTRAFSVFSRAVSLGQPPRRAAARPFFFLQKLLANAPRLGPSTAFTRLCLPCFI